MLVLSRRIGERIELHTGDGLITLAVVRVRGAGERASVGLGIEAPDAVAIRRSEVPLRLVSPASSAADPDDGPRAA
jgi:carbon storage regulator CsrA